jgi:hypothetical protein
MTVKIYDIDVRPLSLEVIFLTDREGEPQRDRIKQAGVTYEEVDQASHAMTNFFQNEICFLVQRPGTTGSKGMALLVEFEFSDEWTPRNSPSPKDSLRVQREWHDCLTFHAPALLHAAKVVESLGDAAASRVTFDHSVPNRGAIEVLLSLPVTTDTFVAAHDMLYANGLKFPHSNHTRLAAAGQLRWHYDTSEFAPNAIPKPSVPLPTKPLTEETAA